MNTYTYTVLFERFKDGDQEGYNVSVPALPEIVTWGQTLEQARANAGEAIACVIESMMQNGEPLPADIQSEHVVYVEKMPVQA